MYNNQAEHEFEMRMEEYYLNKMEEEHDKEILVNVLKFQEEAFTNACKKLNLNGHVTVFDSKKDAITSADKIATDSFYKGMCVKKSYMHCFSLDMTFFFNRDGKSDFAYAGRYNRTDTPEKMYEAFKKANELLSAMDEEMDKLLKEQEKQEEFEI